MGPTTFSIDGTYLAMFFYPATGICPGAHTLCGRDNEGCIVCITFTMGFSTGVEEQNSSGEISSSFVWPNPSSGKFTYTATVIEAGTELELIDIMGKEIQTPHVLRVIKKDAWFCLVMNSITLFQSIQKQ